MPVRTTMRHLEALIARINNIAGTPETYCDRREAKFKAHIGHYHLDSAYGGWRLVQTSNEGGGIRAITSGYVSKSKLYDEMQAFIRGLEAGKERVGLA